MDRKIGKRLQKEREYWRGRGEQIIKSKNIYIFAKRSANLAFPRQVAMYLCRKLTNESFPKIGIEFGGKDHSTVMHSVEKIEKEILENKELANIIEKLKKEII